jgi:hypothetical protein
MPLVCYEAKRFTPAHQRVIAQANEICEQYAAEGLSLTLRQLYYQFVARGYIPNDQKQYDRLGGIVCAARLAGELDWDYLIDRTRNLVELAHWESPSHIMDAVASQYRTDRWADQPTRLEVWIEKDAAIGVVEAVCHRNQVPYFSCRGYTSASELWAGAQRIRRYMQAEQDVVILHVGDHDPSGLDMTRDVRERLERFIEQDLVERRTSLRSPYVGRFDVRRVALNYDQVLQYAPPPNPAKTTDARFKRYQEETGVDESWELDALDPSVLQGLIEREIVARRDPEEWEISTARMTRERETLLGAAGRWPEVVAFLESARG